MLNLNDEELFALELSKSIIESVSLEPSAFLDNTRRQQIVKASVSLYKETLAEVSIQCRPKP